MAKRKIRQHFKVGLSRHKHQTDFRRLDEVIVIITTSEHRPSNILTIDDDVCNTTASLKQVYAALLTTHNHDEHKPQIGRNTRIDQVSSTHAFSSKTGETKFGNKERVDAG